MVNFIYSETAHSYMRKSSSKMIGTDVLLSQDLDEDQAPRLLVVVHSRCHDLLEPLRGTSESRQGHTRLEDRHCDPPLVEDGLDLRSVRLAGVPRKGQDVRLDLGYNKRGLTNQMLRIARQLGQIDESEYVHRAPPHKENVVPMWMDEILHLRNQTIKLVGIVVEESNQKLLGF